MGSSLFERLGGKDSIAAVVEGFSGRVARDTRINKKFGRTNLTRLRGLLVDQLCQVSGGPCVYTGRDMKEAHAGMGVTAGEFDAMIEDLVAALNEFNVAQGDQQQLLEVFDSLRGEVVEVQSNETGTPLPDNYQNAS